MTAHLDLSLRKVILDTLRDSDFCVANDNGEQFNNWDFSWVSDSDFIRFLDALEAKMAERNMYGRTTYPWVIPSETA